VNAEPKERQKRPGPRRPPPQWMVMMSAREQHLLHREIRAKLGGLRRAISSRLLLEGVAWLVVVLVVVVFVTLGLDYHFRLERPLRGLIMSLAGVGVLVVAWRELVRPLSVKMDSPDLALLVERRFGQLGDRLIGAIQFARRGDYEALGTSRAMVERMAAEANALAAPLRFRDVVDHRGMVRMWAAAACAMIVLAGFGLWQTDVLTRWFKRNVLFAEVPWPQETYLAVRGGPHFTVLRGDDLTVVIESEPSSKAVPHHVTLHAKYPSIGATEERVDADPEHPGRFVKVFSAVPEAFRFYVTGGDDRRERAEKYDAHAVRVIDPPALRNVRFTVKYPNYTRRAQPDEFDSASGALAVPVGADVTVRAESNKPLSSAKIVIEGLPDAEMRLTPVGEGAEARHELLGFFEVTGENRPASRTLRFALTDVDGHSNRRGAKYMLQVRPDHSPTVDVKKTGIGVRISPRAVIPLQLRIKDDWGLASAEVTLRRGQEEAEATRLPIELPVDVRDTLAVRHELDIEPLKLSPGGRIHVGVRSTDTLPGSFGGPNVGTSSLLNFRIVKPEELLEEFIRRQKEIRLEFEQAMALQNSARAKTGAAAQLFAAGQVTPEARRLLATSAGLQSSVGAEIAKAADGLAAIVEEMKNNRIATQTEREQIRDGIVKPLRALTEPVRKVTGSIHATKGVDRAGELKAQADAVEEIQGDLLARMEEILQRMAKLESKQELASKLQVIIKWSEQLLESIKKKQEAEVGKVFDPTTRPAGTND
jgi:hypothetical protein